MAYSIYSKAGTDEAISSALADSLPTAPADIGAATAAQGALADATTVEQVTLTANLAYTLPAGTPAGVVHRVVFTQTTGRHTVTYGGQPVAVDLTAGAVTTVELIPLGDGVWRPVLSLGTRRPGTGGATDGDVVTIGRHAYILREDIGTAIVIGGATLRENVIGGNTSNVDQSVSNLTGAPALTGVDGNWSAILHGYDNVNNGWACIQIGFHLKCEAGANHGTISGGSLHSIAADVGYATIGGGTGNAVGASYGTVGGGSLHSIAAGAGQSTIGGGATNAVTGARGTVAGGTVGTAGPGTSATVGGGTSNVASGTGATVAGGISNTASGSNSTVGGGTGNIASASNSSITGGTNGKASVAGATVVGGTNNEASAYFSTVIGGWANKAPGSYSVAWGREAVSSRYGGQVQAAGKIATEGDAQTSVLVARRQTTDATPTILTLDGGAYTPIVIATNSAAAFSAMVVGRRVDVGGEASAAYEMKGLVRNDGGTVTLVGTPIVTVLGETDATWDATVAANDTANSLEITVTGAAGLTINWTARVTLVEVAG